jgi:hypothetical protein
VRLLDYLLHQKENCKETSQRLSRPRYTLLIDSKLEVHVSRHNMYQTLSTTTICTWKLEEVDNAPKDAEEDISRKRKLIRGQHPPHWKHR